MDVSAFYERYVKVRNTFLAKERIWSRNWFASYLRECGSVVFLNLSIGFPLALSFSSIFSLSLSLISLSLFSHLFLFTRHFNVQIFSRIFPWFEYWFYCSLPDTKVLSFEHNDLHDYDRAHRMGKNNVYCSSAFRDCSFSLIELALGRYTKPYSFM